MVVVLIDHAAAGAAAAAPSSLNVPLSVAQPVGSAVGRPRRPAAALLAAERRPQGGDVADVDPLGRLAARRAAGQRRSKQASRSEHSIATHVSRPFMVD